MESRTSTMQNLSMQRRHFQMIANVFAQGQPLGCGPKSDAHRECWTALAESFASRLASTNPGFDRARFLAACGME